MNIDQKAQAGIGLLKEAIVGYLELNRHGCGNSEIAKALNIESDFEGNQKNYLSWSILGMLVNDGAIKYKLIDNRRRYFPIDLEES